MTHDTVSLDVMAAAIEAFPEGIVVIEKTGPEKTDFVFALMNEAFERIGRTNRDLLLRERVADHFPMLIETGYFDRCTAALETAEPQTLEPTLYDDGRIRVWTRTTYTPLDATHVMITGLDITDAMESLTAQSALIERMRRVERLAKVGSWRWDLTQDNLEWSSEVKRIYGLDPDATPSYELEREVIHPDDRAERDAIAEQWMSAKQGGSHEYRLLIDGRVRHIRGVAEAVTRDGELVEMTGAIQDISEVVDAHQQRLEAESKFHTLFDTSPVGVLLIASDGTIKAANGATAELFGLPAEASSMLEGHNLFDDTQILDLGLRWHVERALAGETVHVPPHRYDLAQTMPAAVGGGGGDHARWMEITMFPFDDGAAAFARDVTLPHLARQQLKKASAIIDSMSNGLVVTDTEGTIIDVNPAFSEITGYTREEAIGSNPRLLKSGEHDARFYERMWRDLI